MMNFAVKLTCTALCTVSLFSVFSPNAYAMRGGTNSTLKSPAAIKLPSQNSVNKTSLTLDVAPDGFAAYTLSCPLSIDGMSEKLVDTHLAVGDYAPPGAVDVTFSASDSWPVAESVSRASRTSPRGSMNRVTLALASNSSKTISVSATARSSGIIQKMGLRSLRLQRYIKGRWVTIYSTSNEYCYRISRFMYTTTRRNLVSGNYYRVSATFLGDTGTCITSVTKTSGAVRCR